jgi:glycosyltransferase involved in cell wall biosynthesis
MRILLTADTVGGVWTYAVELARALAPHGVETVLATMGAPLGPRQRAELASIPRLRVFESRFRLEWMEDSWEDVRRAGDWLLALERETRPDAIHLNGYAHGALPWRAPVLVVGHSCVLSWWEAVHGRSAPPGWDRYREEVTRGLRAADMVAAPTRAMLAALQRHYGPLPRTRVMLNGRDPALFPPAAKQPLVFAAGRLWDDAKNIGALDAAAAEIEWPAYVAGETAHPDGLKADYRHVRPLGRLDTGELAGWLGRAAIYALPARYEPFGLSVLEAAFAGCALVLGDIPSLREVWGESAVFIPPGDRAALSSTLKTLIADEFRRKALAEAARTRAFEFTPERMAASYLATYRYLLGAASAEAEENEKETVCAS